ncbi:glycosyltransferase [Patescibacteria group bacterium]
MNIKKIDIIVPAFNEKENVEKLIVRIDKSLKKANLDYKLIIVDDNSSDGTYKEILKFIEDYPVVVHKKKGKQGKAYSILEGSKLGSSDYVVMIDADLQYPPEYIPKLVDYANKNPDFGVVIGERVLDKNFSPFRKFLSRGSRLINARLIMGFPYDTQSGLKLFRREVIKNVSVREVSPWALDIPLINEAVQMGYQIGQVEIPFKKRSSGFAKIHLLHATREILWGALKVRLKPKKIYDLISEIEDSMLGSGLIYKKRRFITHSTLPHHKSAIKTITPWQMAIVLLTLLIAGLSLDFFTRNAAIIMMAILTVIYFSDVLFNLFLIFKSLHFPPEISFSKRLLAGIKNKDLPVYTILSPLYREGEVLGQFINSIKKLDYPKDKLDVILLLEEDDKDTISRLNRFKLPGYFRSLIVPHSIPKTKPKACNYGLNHAKGEYIVVYDAEDIPDPMQLKKAYLGFKKLGDKVSCLQAKLNYYNPHQNILTRLFTAEYSLWFDMILPALQSIDTTIPLGGTSNHFRTSELLKFKGWDPFNVTEDADLGVRIFREGGKTAIIDSVTLEEANSNLKNWIRQRSRWIKGYMQTYLVHMRNPLSFFKENNKHFFIFQLIAGLRISFMLINPFMWAMTAAYFTLYSIFGPTIEALYPSSIFYMALISAVFGNFLYIYYYMIGAAKREQWGVIKYVFFVPVYWIFTSVAGFVALYQLIAKPHFWEKTVHGLNLTKKEQKRFRFAFVAQLKDLGFGGIKKARTYLKPEYVQGAFLIAATLLGNFFGFLYNAYLGRKLSLEDFGLISLFGSFVYISSVLTSALGRTLTHKSAYLFGKYKGPVKQLWFYYRKNLIYVSIVVTAIWLGLSPLMTGLFKSEGIYPFLIFAPVWIMTIVGSIDDSFLTGSLLFGIVSGLTIIHPIAKFILTYVFVELGYYDAVYLSFPLSIFISYVLGYFVARSIKGVKKHVDMRVVTSFPKKFFITSFFSKLSTIVILSFDLVLAKLFLSPDDAGRYALVSVVGKMVFFLSSIFSQFIIPYASKENAEGQVRNSSFAKLFFLITLSTVGGVVVFGILGSFTAPFLMGSKALAITSFLPLFSIGVAMHSMSTNLIAFNQAKKKYIFPIVGFGLSLFTLFGLLLFHESIWDFVRVMFVGGVFSLGGTVILHYYYGELRIIINNIKDLIGLFARRIVSEDRFSKEQLRILFFNWRDTKHLWAGGAEVYIHELAKRLVKKGHRVTVFCGNDGKNPRNEVVDGVQIIRRGGFYTVFIWAFLYYSFRLRNYFDVIIDSENGIPFFTPLYAKKKIFLLIHHVHQEVFRIRLKPPFSSIGYALEKYAMPMVYRNTEVITVSPSSKADILENKLTSKEPHVIYNGVDTSIYKPARKSETPLVLYLGRLTPQKSLTVFINMAKEIVKRIPEVKFVIAGDGEEKDKLIKLTRTLGLEKYIEFKGRVTEKEKVKLYQKSWVFVNPSLMEGWGITTIEANACATPVVASNVKGLRDAVHNPHSGELIPYGNVEEFSEMVINLIINTEKRKQMSQDARTWSNKFSWEKSTDDLIKII